MIISRFRLVITAALLTAVGCTAAEGGDVSILKTPPLQSLAGSNGGDPPKGLNGKRPSCFWDVDTQAAYRTFGDHLLNQGGHELLEITTIATDCRDEVIANAIECALTEEQWVVDPVTQQPYYGHWGLAPNWYSEPLDADGRRWVTGCMGQRLNYFSEAEQQQKSVPILLKGAHPAINDVPAYDLDYPFVESIVYGDIFSAPPTNVTLNVCWTKDLEESCDTTGSIGVIDWLKLRICDSVPGCGLKIVGQCEEVCGAGIDGYAVCKQENETLDDHTVQVQLLKGMECEDEGEGEGEGEGE